LRYSLEYEPKEVNTVLHIFLRVIEGHLRRTTLGASPHTRFEALSFVHRFGSLLHSTPRRLNFIGSLLDRTDKPGSMAVRLISMSIMRELPVQHLRTAIFWFWPVASLRRRSDPNRQPARR
jgi:hypothetical protein